MEVYFSYIKVIGYGLTTMFFIIYILSSVMGVMSNLWLADWTDHAKEIQQAENATTGQTNIRLGIYASLGMSQGLLTWKNNHSFSDISLYCIYANGVGNGPS